MAGKSDVLLGWCDGGQVEGIFMDSMLRIVRDSDRLHGWARQEGLYITKSRNGVARFMLDEVPEANWLWMVDSDMWFPPKALDRLLTTAHALERPIVGGVYWGPWLRPSTGEWSVAPHLYSLADDGSGFIRWDVDKLGQLPESGRMEVAGAGTGCLLIHRRVLENLRDTFGEPHPVFEERVVGEGVWGEDLTFCVRAREAGFPTWVDLSVRCWHKKPMVLSGDGTWMVASSR